MSLSETGTRALPHASHLHSRTNGLPIAPRAGDSSSCECKLRSIADAHGLPEPCRFTRVATDPFVGKNSPQTNTSKMSRNTEKHSLVGKVVDGVVTGILSNKYRTALPRHEILSKEFGVSLSVVREALAMLLARNMIEKRPKIGTRIRAARDWRVIDEEVVNWRFHMTPDPAFVRDAVEVRMLIEPRAAALAATNASTADIATIDTAFKAFCAKPPGVPGHTAIEEALHIRIIIASGNQIFRQMTPIIRGALLAMQPPEELTPDAWMQTVRLHLALVDAIAKRYPKGAEAASIALIDSMMHHMKVSHRNLE